jgi:hypothetical protein
MRCGAMVSPASGRTTTSPEQAPSAALVTEQMPALSWWITFIFANRDA